MAIWDALRRRSPDDRRRRLLERTPPGPLRDFLSHPLPDPATRVEDLRLLAVDVETTGLDPRRHQLLSIGFVPVNGREIDLSGARRLLLRAPREVGESATIHGLTDDQLSAGMNPEEALRITLEALAGRVLLAHYTDMEEGFLGVACEQAFGAAPVFSTVDTMHLQYELLTRGFDDEPPRDALRLWNARARYGLPVYRAHEALTDALACAELYLALIEEPGTGETLASLQR